MNNSLPIRYAFFGSSQFSLYILEELEKIGMLPEVVITTPPRPVGRKLLMTPTVVSVWATTRKIPVLSPEKLDNMFVYDFRHFSPTISIVASYGKIIPKEILDIPRWKTLNVHPSLLPKYRGATPIQKTILEDDKKTGVTIILLDELMDHGPILSKEETTFDEWKKYEDIEEILGRVGGKLTEKTMKSWVDDKIKPEEQDHTKATFTKKIEKEDGKVDLNKEEIDSGIIIGNKARQIYLKLLAYSKWPGVFFFIDTKRIKIKEFNYNHETGILDILSIIPENKPEIPYRDLISKI